MIRPKKKILFESKVLGKLPKDYEDIGFNECHDLDTKYIESLKLEAQKLWDEIVELKKDKKDLMSHLDSKSEVKKPSVEEIEKVINNNEIGKLAWHYDIEKQIKKVAQAIDKLNNKEE